MNFDTFRSYMIGAYTLTISLGVLTAYRYSESASEIRMNKYYLTSLIDQVNDKAESAQSEAEDAQSKAKEVESNISKCVGDGDKITLSNCETDYFGERTCKIKVK